MTFGINKLGKKNPRAFEMQIKHQPMVGQRIIREGGGAGQSCSVVCCIIMGIGGVWSTQKVNLKLRLLCTNCKMVLLTR